jgi:hypothetical protein
MGSEGMSDRFAVLAGYFGRLLLPLPVFIAKYNKVEVIGFDHYFVVL